jgi:hypothetical protein
LTAVLACSGVTHDEITLQRLLALLTAPLVPTAAAVAASARRSPASSPKPTAKKSLSSAFASNNNAITNANGGGGGVGRGKVGGVDVDFPILQRPPPLPADVHTQNYDLSYDAGTFNYIYVFRFFVCVLFYLFVCFVCLFVCVLVVAATACRCTYTELRPQL